MRMEGKGRRPSRTGENSNGEAGLAVKPWHRRKVQRFVDVLQLDADLMARLRGCSDPSYVTNDKIAGYILFLFGPAVLRRVIHGCLYCMYS